jgi:DNA-binding MarR family transcriptional regulator
MAPAPDKNDFGFVMADITRLLRRVFDRRAAHLELTRVQWRALSRIHRLPGLSQSELAEDLEVEPVAIGRVLDRLEAAGFIERRADPDDRRCRRLHAAPKSAEVMAAMRRLASDLRADVLDAIAPDDLATTLRVLGEVKERLHEIDREAKADSARGNPD